jgi:tripartite-type tricarboxylate transporter receptor subunit TctC
VASANHLFKHHLGLLGLVGILLSGPASAQAPDASFPNRPIKIISASPAGGGVDLSARIVRKYRGKAVQRSGNVC